MTRLFLNPMIMSKRKTAAALLALCLLALPVWAVFNERDLAQTLSVLRYELQQDYLKMSRSEERLGRRNDSRHGQMVELMKKCNELSLILYSQNQDYTFDVTYALKEVTRQYNDFSTNKMPYDDMLARLNLEIDRYERLVASLERLPSQQRREEAPPVQMDSARRQRYDSLGIRTGHRERPEEPEGRDSLRRERPFLLNEGSMEDRDSCLFYATALLNMYTQMRNRVIVDSDHYEDASARLDEIYTYAQDRYKLIQKNIFVKGQDNYLSVLKTLPSYAKTAWSEVKAKYGSASNAKDNRVLVHSEWRGPVVAGFSLFVLAFILLASLLTVVIITLLKKRVKLFQEEEFRLRTPCITLLCGVVIFAVTMMILSATARNNFFVEASSLILVFAWLVAAILASLLIRLKGEELKPAMVAYSPVILLGLLVISFRIIFIPNKMVNLVFPPLMVLFFFWQLHICRKVHGKIRRVDMIFCWISLFIIGVTAAVALAGYVLLAVQAFIWWLFQLAAIQTVITLFDLLDKYRIRFLEKKKDAYDNSHLSAAFAGKRGNYIRVTWFFDLLEMAVVPVLAILTVPLSIYMAAGVFDLTEVCRTIFHKPFFNLADADGNAILHLSLYKLVLVSSLFFIFKYISYLIRSVWRVEKLEKVKEESGQDYIHANQVNLTLANNVVSILVWGTYAVACIILLRIPMGAISIVAAGLATGIGLALKDILNNFIYGIQLMSGRLRVGDYIECDGIRGKVDSITYQSTQIETLEGAVMAFTNTTLFNKNFKNLTRNNSYEFIKIGVGVGYGTDVEKVRGLLVDAISSLQRTDRFGRKVLDPARKVTVVVNDFGDNAVELAIKQYVLVEEEYAYIAAAKEIIYNTLNNNGIEIPFPQRDIHVKVEKETTV